jgi:hypothetical protein
MKSWKCMAAIAALSLAMPLQALASGAIAVDDEDGGEAGYAWITGAKSQDTAGWVAMSQCIEAGGKACRVAVRFEACAAYAASWRFSSVGRGPTKASASMMALRNCEGCKIVVADCDESGPQEEPELRAATTLR